jgi:hypothetical protein
VGLGWKLLPGVELGWGLSAETGPVIAKNPKIIATQTNIAASNFLNSEE